MLLRALVVVVEHGGAEAYRVAGDARARELVAPVVLRAHVLPPRFQRRFKIRTHRRQLRLQTANLKSSDKSVENNYQVNLNPAKLQEGVIIIPITFRSDWS